MTEPEQRSPLSMGLEWASKISSLGFVFAAPPLLGLFLDRRLGVAPAGILIGMAVGFAAGIFYVLRIAGGSSRPG